MTSTEDKVLGRTDEQVTGRTVEVETITCRYVTSSSRSSRSGYVTYVNQLNLFNLQTNMNKQLKYIQKMITITFE